MSKIAKKTLQNIADAFNVNNNYLVTPKIKENLYGLYQDAYYIYDKIKYSSKHTLDFQKIEKAYQALLEEKEKILTQVEVLDTKDIEKDINYLVKTFDEVKIRKLRNRNSIKISVVTKDILVTYNGDTVNFGKFRIEVFFTKNDTRHNEMARIISINKPGLGYPHPHVCNGHLCFGDGLTSFNNCVDSNLIAEAFDIVLAILSEYNPSSPYRKFEFFIQKYCSICKNRIYDSYLSSCPVCGEEIICSRCSRHNSTEGKSTCCNCVDLCDRCTNYYTKTEGETLCQICRDFYPAKTTTETQTVTETADISADNHTIEPDAQTETTIYMICKGCNRVVDTWQEHEGETYCPHCLFDLILRTEGID